MAGGGPTGRPAGRRVVRVVEGGPPRRRQGSAQSGSAVRARAGDP